MAQVAKIATAGAVTVLAALALTIVTTLSATAAEPTTVPAVFHGDWCPIAGKSELYRRGQCPQGIRIAADGYAHKAGRCRLTGTFQGPKAFLAGFDCKAKGDPQVEPINMWMRINSRDQLNMWISDVAP